MIELTWQAAAHKAEAQALVLWGPVRQRALQRLQQYSDEQLQPLSILLTAQCWVLLGQLQHLPWLDGAAYAAPDRTLTELWLPTGLVPDVCTTLVLQQLKQQYPASPLLMWPQPPAVISLKNPYPLSRALLAAMQEQLA